MKLLEDLVLDTQSRLFRRTENRRHAAGIESGCVALTPHVRPTQAFPHGQLRNSKEFP